MGWLSTLFSKSTTDVVTSVGKALDDLITSDEEIALTEIEQQKIKTAYRLRLQELLMQMDREAAMHEEKQEQELTERLRLDMKSDSWLSKNIRPMTLIFMTVSIVILMFLTIFNSGLTPDQVKLVEEWIPFFQTIMLTIYGFYFGSRGIEKIQKIRSARESNSRIKNMISAFDQEPKG
ncbi:hypothetical protein [Glaciecola sp. 1036]|uniref:hypothetical protein n=1 Tax=Alteromonadaceae TaxID=72275 RepID=UPI003CFFC97D